jgi:hypothetical protein
MTELFLFICKIERRHIHKNISLTINLLPCSQAIKIWADLTDSLMISSYRGGDSDEILFWNTKPHFVL